MPLTATDADHGGDLHHFAHPGARYTISLHACDVRDSQTIWCCQASIDKVKADFEDPDKPMYAAAHIYVTYELDNMLIHSLKQVRAGLFADCATVSGMIPDVLGCNAERRASRAHQGLARAVHRVPHRRAPGALRGFVARALGHIRF